MPTTIITILNYYLLKNHGSNKRFFSKLYDGSKAESAYTYVVKIM